MPETAFATEVFLYKQLRLSHKKIILLENLSLTKKPATQDEAKLLGEIQRTNSGIIALALEHEHQMHQKLGKDYQPFLLESNEQKDLFADFLAGIEEGKIYRFNFIIGGRGLHATPVVIDSDGTQVRIFSLDAALYYDNFSCIDMFAHATNARTYKYTGGGIQNSAFGCSIYSIGHLREMAKMNANELESMFNDAMSRETDQYLGLKPEFVTNMQSMGGMERYLSAHQDANDVKAAKEQNTTKIFDGKSIKLRNYSITDQNHQVLVNASKMLQNLSEEQFQTIFERRTGNQALQQAYDDLTAEQIRKVNGIYNSDKIALVLNDIASHEQISGTDVKCFGPRQEDSRNAAGHIRKLSLQGDLEPLKTLKTCSGPQLTLLMQNSIFNTIFTNVETESWQGKQYLFDLQVLEAYNRGTRFEQIKDCNNAYAVEAISRYNISPELANHATCFEDPGNQAIAISFIRRAFDEAQPGQKVSMAQTVFSRIKENPCNINHEVAALYKEAIKTAPPSPDSITHSHREEDDITDHPKTRWRAGIITSRQDLSVMHLDF